MNIALLCCHAGACRSVVRMDSEHDSIATFWSWSNDYYAVSNKTCWQNRESRSDNIYDEVLYFNIYTHSVMTR